jgi:hypothetical protein
VVTVAGLVSVEAKIGGAVIELGALTVAGLATAGKVATWRESF